MPSDKTVELKVDFGDFNKALQEYQFATKKTFAEVANREMVNLGVQGIKVTKEAEASKIQSIQSMDWWPKLVAKALVKRNAGKLVSKMQGATTAKGMKSVSRAMGKFYGRAYTHAQAVAFSALLIRRRLNAIRFLKFFFSKLAKEAKPFTSSGASGSGIGKSFGGFQYSITPATDSKPSCSARIWYTPRYRGDKSVRTAQVILDAAMKNAITATAADMRAYIVSKMTELSQKYSYRGAKGMGA
jgi:hypothetical protein